MDAKKDSGSHDRSAVLIPAIFQDKDGRVLAKGGVRVLSELRLHGIFYPNPEASLGALQDKVSFLDTSTARYRVLNFELCSACSFNLHYEFDLEPVGKPH